MRLGVQVALTPPYAQVVKLVVTPGLNPGAERRASSNLALRNNMRF